MHRVEALTAEVRELHGEAVELRLAVARHTRTLLIRTRIVFVLLVAVVALGVMAVAQLHAQVAAGRRAAEDQRRLCPLIKVLIPQPGEAAPSTPRGQKVVEQATRLSRQLNC